MSDKYIIDRLKENGYKLTKQREAIIQVLKENDGHYNANELFNMVAREISGINFSTIYRNLELLVKLEIVNKLSIEEGLNHFELADKGHHHHVICKSCGKVKEIDLCPYKEFEKSKLKEIGFKPMEHRFEIYGLCSKCMKKD